MAADRPSLETDRLRLRPFVDADLDDYAELVSDPEVMQYIGSGAMSRADAARSLEFLGEHWNSRGYGLWAAEEKASGTLVGRIGLLQPLGWPGLEVGWLVKRSRWGQGFATEGGRAALDFGFRQLLEDRILSLIEPANIASIRVAEKLGERFDGRLELNGKRVSVYAIDRRIWEQRDRPD